jgi:hypothetical protein
MHRSDEPVDWQIEPTRGAARIVVTREQAVAFAKDGTLPGAAKAAPMRLKDLAAFHKAEEPKAEEPKTDPQPEASPTATAEPQPSTSEAGSAVNDAGTATTAEPAAISYADVKNAVLQLSVARGRETVFALLNKYGANKSAQEIDPAHYADVMETIAALMEG